MMLLLTLLYAANYVVCWLMADADADTIRRGRKVSHFFNAVIHLLVALVISVSVNWIAGLASLFQAKAAFDMTLNVRRFGWKGLFYVPANPDSWLDRLEKTLFGSNGWLPKLFYTAAFVGLLFLLKNH